MPSTDKFLFFRSFDEPDPKVQEAKVEEEQPEEPEVVVPTFSEEELNNARAEGMAAGREEGIREASETTERLINETTQAIHTQMNDLFGRQINANGEIFKDAINTSVAVVKKCFPKMTSEHGTTEIESLIGEILAQILEEPRVVISVNQDLKSPLSERMEGITKIAHFDGRVVIRGESDIDPGNCKIEWSNGGAERNLEEIWQQIDHVIEDNLSAAESGMEFETIQPPESSNPSEIEESQSSDSNINDESIAESDTQSEELIADEPALTSEESLPPSEPEHTPDIQSFTPSVPTQSSAETANNSQKSGHQEDFDRSPNPSDQPDFTPHTDASTTESDVQREEEDNAGMEPGAEAGILPNTTEDVEPNKSEPSE